MRLVSEHKWETPRDERVVRIYTGGIREVFKGDSESWSRYVIIPRRSVLSEIRRQRKRGFTFAGMGGVLGVIPDGAARLIRSESYSGPGQSFTHAPYKIKSSRKFVIIYQRGGLDI